MMLNYECNEDCFAKTRHVKSIPLYGNEAYVKAPLFTILIPTYRRLDTFREALRSVLKQWHVPFMWEILVVDNEPYAGVANTTEEFIEKLNNKRIRYYRNSENLRPADNFNRGFLLARGKWVMMLHDDDILLPNALHNMYNVLTALSKVTTKPIGAISVKYHQFRDGKKEIYRKELKEKEQLYTSQDTNYGMYELTHHNILFLENIGGDVPSNGATYLRQAVLEMGGFNEDFGISGDLILYYCLENKYAVFSTTVPYGFYRWGSNSMSKPEKIYDVIQFHHDFRQYVYAKNWKNKLWGRIFGTCQHYRFCVDVLKLQKHGTGRTLPLSQVEQIESLNINRRLYAVYTLIIRPLYLKYKIWKIGRLYQRIVKVFGSQMQYGVCLDTRGMK